MFRAAISSADGRSVIEREKPGLLAPDVVEAALSQELATSR
ncbi:hypothetical protein ACIGW3_14290 [Streptomyces sp. NPDC053499]